MHETYTFQRFAFFFLKKHPCCRSDLLQEVMEGGHAAVGPFEALLGVSKIAHDVSVLPAAFFRARSAEVTRRWRTIVNGAQSIAERNCLADRGKSRKLIFFHDFFFYAYRWPTSCAATMIPLNPPVSSMIATEFTFSRRLFTTQAPPTYANPARKEFFSTLLVCASRLRFLRRITTKTIVSILLKQACLVKN